MCTYCKYNISECINTVDATHDKFSCRGSEIHSLISARIANTTYQNVSILLMQHNKISTQLDYGKITTLECMNVLHLSPCYEPTWVI